MSTVHNINFLTDSITQTDFSIAAIEIPIDQDTLLFLSNEVPHRLSSSYSCSLLSLSPLDYWRKKDKPSPPISSAFTGDPISYSKHITGKLAPANCPLSTVKGQPLSAHTDRSTHRNLRVKNYFTGNILWVMLPDS